MREGALFATMFGLGAGAVLVGVTVSRLVVGQAPEKPADERPVAATEAAPPVIVGPPPPAVVSPAAEPPVMASPAAEPPAAGPVIEPPTPPATQRQHRTIVRKHRHPPIQEETPLATAPVPTGEAQPDAPSPVVGHAPIAIVRGGVARRSPDARAPGARIIAVDPHDTGR